MTDTVHSQKTFWNAGEPDDVLFARIDSIGGWPAGFPYLVMIHGCNSKRECYFSQVYRHDEWNTTLHHANNYHWWKITPDRKAAIRKKFIADFKKTLMKI
jgi:hypothetical protein